MNNYKIIRDKKDTLYLLCLSDDVKTLYVCHMFVTSFPCVVKSPISTFFHGRNHMYIIINHENSFEILELKIELISVNFTMLITNRTLFCFALFFNQLDKCKYSTVDKNSLFFQFQIHVHFS